MLSALQAVHAIAIHGHSIKITNLLSANKLFGFIPTDGDDRKDVNRAKSLNITRLEKQTIVANRISLPLFILSISGVLNACSSEGVSQNETLENAESPELGINSNSAEIDGIATVDTVQSTIPTSESSGGTIDQISAGSETALISDNESELTASEAPVLNAANPLPEPNKAPEIMSISLGCDLATESVGIQMGDSAEIFLLIDDESPLELSYVLEMRTPDIASVAVDSEGMLLVSGLTLGQTDLSIEVVDSEGLTDTIVIPIIVDL